MSDTAADAGACRYKSQQEEWEESRVRVREMAQNRTLRPLCEIPELVEHWRWHGGKQQVY